MEAYVKISALILIYVILLLFCRLFSKRMIITPEFVFIACFIPQMVFAMKYVKKWDLNLSIDTVLIYIFGGVNFVFFSIFFRYILRKYNYGQQGLEENAIVSKEKREILNKKKLLIIIVIQIFSIVIMSRTLLQITKAQSLPSAISSYTILSKGTGLKLPSFAGKLNLFSYISGYVWAYYIVYGVANKRKEPYFLLGINFALSVVSNLLTGSRGGVIQNVLFLFILYYILDGEKKKWRKVVSPKILMMALLFVIAVLFGFQKSLDLIGRVTSTKDSGDYIALYLSAEIKNIDIMIRSGEMQIRNILEWRTLNSGLSSFLKLVGISLPRNVADASTYITYHGINLGNVYTIYYSFVHDLSYFGLIFFEMLMALISQISLVSMMRSRMSYFVLDFSKLIYGYILVKISFSFFSNWFFDNILSTGFIWCLIFWFILRAFMEYDVQRKEGRVRIKITNNISIKI